MVVKVSPKYQVVIPEEVRKALNIKAGTMVDVVKKGGVAYLVPVMSIKEIQRQIKDSFSLNDLREKQDRIK